MNKDTPHKNKQITKTRLSKSMQRSGQRGYSYPNEESKADGVFSLRSGNKLTPEHRAKSVEVNKPHAEKSQKGYCPFNKESKAEGVPEAEGVFNLRKGDNLTSEHRAEPVEVNKSDAEKPRKLNCLSNTTLVKTTSWVPEAEGVFNLGKGDNLTSEYRAESVEVKKPGADEPQKGNCPSNTTQVEEEDMKQNTNPTGQYISQNQMSQLQELAMEEEKALKLLMNLAQKMSSVLEGVRGPIEKCIKRPLSVELAGIIMSIIMALLIGIAVYLYIFLNESEPVEITATTWWEKFTSLAKNYINFFK